MPYNSTITFTLDTICPWTYLAYLRFSRSLSEYTSSHPPDDPNTRATFTLQFAPYQLYPDASQDGEDKYKWYLKEKYNNDASLMDKYTAYMTALGKAEGVEFDFGGTMANTLHAHRAVMCVQEEKGAEAGRRCVESLYTQYFTQKAHPSAPSTLLTACRAAGLDEEDAKTLVEDESEGLVDVKAKIREQAGNGVDSVPYVVFEGRRRDFTMVGAKEVGEYLKVLEQVGKEA
ncbi:thioredoxin-like protein [Lophiostoma macrostomum CBS 122681]|uniref:Thioredoxin-like protein n=1 Tax=Lophiostoma macrostomum CBS 122681 TaxID=1314788 RepID=A0A6A6T4L0_9PLEO|nr:thioredoxin-like protein [Lophiostoma macrostomum CBS 122681]